MQPGQGPYLRPYAGLRIELSVLEPWPGHCITFLRKTLYSHSASLHPGVYMNTGEFTAGGGGGPCDGLASRPRGSSNTFNHFVLLKPG